MEVIQARKRGSPTAGYTRIVVAALIGALLVGVGLAVAYLALSTPIVATISRLGQGRIGSVGGALTYALAFLIPGSLVVAGVSRIASALDLQDALRGPRKRPVASLAGELPDDYSVAEGVRLPDRRVVPEVVVGPAGLLVVEELPPSAASRHRGPYWEVRLAIGRWIPIENPVERAARDAARLKNWLRSEEEDLSPRMYAAVIADGHEVERTNEVAVLTRDQIPAFLAAMPPIHHMTRERRARITNLLRQRL
jgi:hypothetical protein